MRAVADFGRPYAALRYPPIFVTVDALLVQSSHVLLVKRSARPGRGLWALPGGFLEAGEAIDHAWVRELMEETAASVGEDALRAHLVARRVFDDPHRDPRGRFVTHAHMVRLPPSAELPRVTAGDDADAVRWWPIADLRPEHMFADHLGIVRSLLGTGAPGLSPR